jgi:hypothetical protein
MDVKLRLKSFIASEIFATFRGTCKPKLFLSNSRKLLGCLGFVIILGSTVSGFTGVTTFSEQKEATLGLPGSLSPDANYEKPSIEKLDGNRVHIYFGTPPPYARTPGGNDRIQLVNSKNAADPTWEQLKLFLLLDKTDQKDYDSLSYPCGAYAEEVHNNAEAAGIKAAWIAVEFEGDSIRHALNGFRTTDRGLVWIDCTNLWPTNCARDGVYSQDKVAYLVVGEEYGLINLNVAPGFDYAAYEEYVQKRLDCESLSKVYYQKAREYMVEIQQYDERSSLPMGQVSPGDPDRGQEWNEQLEMEKAGLDVLGENVERLRESLGPSWSTLGMVTSVEIYW